MDYLENTIVDYWGRNEMCLGVVVKTGIDRLQVKGVGEQTNRVAVKQVLTSHGSASSNHLNRLAEIQAEIIDVMAEIDVELLWQDALEQGRNDGLAELTANYFGEATPIRISAMARKLLEDNLRFKFQQLAISPRQPEEIEEILRLREARAARAAVRERTKQWLDDVLSHRGDEPVAVPEEQETFVRQSLDYLLCGFAGEAVNLLSAARAKMTAREVAIKLLKVTGRLPDDADEFLLVNGIHAGFSADVLEHAETLTLTIQDKGRDSHLDLEVFSIDDAETREIDDALSCRRENGGFVVGVHIADPAHIVLKGDCLDDAAVERPLSLYLPTTTVTMFPERVGCDLSSLVAGQERASLSFTIGFTEAGEMTTWSFAPAVVRVGRRLTHAEANQLLVDGADSVAESLRDLLFLASKRRELREAAGGVSFNRPELKIRVRGGEVTVTPDDQDTPSHQLVSEFMILANHLAARYAVRCDIPVIYRAQDPPVEPVTPIEVYEPHLFDQQIKRMKRTRLSTCPQPHFGLGLDIYTQVSSPLRRYADLVIQRQLAAHLRGEELPYTLEELFAVLDNVDRTSGQNRALEREANRYWLLEFLKRNQLGEVMPATVVRVEGSFVLAELDTYIERGVLMCRNRLQVGQRLTVRIREVYPEASRMVLVAE